MRILMLMNLVMMCNDHDDSDPEGEVEKRETAPFECFHVPDDIRAFSVDTWVSNPMQLQIIPGTVFIASVLGL